MWLNHYFMPYRYAHTRVVVKYSYTFTLRTTSRSLFKSLIKSRLTRTLYGRARTNNHYSDDDN